MSKFMYSGSYTRQGVKGLLREGGTARRDETVRIVESLGGQYKGKLKMLMASMIGVDQSNVKNSVSVDGQVMKYEPIFIFHKPSLDSLYDY